MAPKKPKKPKPPTAAVPATAPAEGERRALRGYIGQYERAGAAIYAALERDELLWIGVADRNAGIADDLLLGFDGLVVGHQFKTSKFPGTFTVETLFTGANGLLSSCLAVPTQGQPGEPCRDSPDRQRLSIDY